MRFLWLRRTLGKSGKPMAAEGLKGVKALAKHSMTGHGIGKFQDDDKRVFGE